MPGSFYGIGMSSRALRAFQQGLDVVGHNIANANTVGFTRQQVEFNSVDGPNMYGANAFRLGNGVDITSVNRIRDQFLDARRLSAQSEQRKSSTMLGTLNSIQSVLNEPSTQGVSAALGKFFDSWSGLAGNPGDTGLRVQVQQASLSLASKIRDTHREILGQRNSNSEAITATFDRIDELASGLATINNNIRAAQLGGASANDLLDQQAGILQELGGLAKIQTIPSSDGTVGVSLGGFSLVDRAGAHSVPRTYDATNSTIASTSGAVFSITGGQLTAQFQSEAKLDTTMVSLNSLAKALAAEVNTIHQTGVNPLGQGGVEFFSTIAGAGDFAVSAAIASDPQAIATGVTGKAGDGGLALSLSGLRDAKISTLGDRTFNTFYSEFATGIGRDVGYYQGLVDTQSAVVNQIDRQIESISGVSIDDEMANLLKFQRSYQAAAKTLAIFDQITEDLINLVR